jgi:hypothetical protein
MEIIESNGNFEVRKYPPQKRTIMVCGRYYYLPMPHIIFVKSSGYKYGGLPCDFLHVAFADEFSRIYFPPLSNIHSQTWAACIGSARNKIAGYEFAIDCQYSFEELIAEFWGSSFSYPGPNCFARSYRALTTLQEDNSQYQTRLGFYKAWSLFQTPQNLLDKLKDIVTYDKFIDDICKNPILDNMMRQIDIERKNTETYYDEAGDGRVVDNRGYYVK